MPDSISDYLAAAEDNYAPPFPNPPLQQYDNYCIYSIACIDTTSNKTSTIHGQFINNQIVSYNPPAIENTTSINKKTNLLAIQTFSTVPIPIDFMDYVNNYHEQ